MTRTLTLLIVAIACAGPARGGEPVTMAALETRARALREGVPRLLDRPLTVRVERPFVVVGDSDPRGVQRWAEGTVRWAVARLKSRYFTRDPEQVITIWLMRDRASYLAACRHVMDDPRYDPGTPFGFYSSWKRAMVMNISTGGGTLVHEIVHPYVEANFPGCPPWLNEGLGSLYEQSGERAGKIVGLTNWRLRGLKQAIAAKRLPSIATLCAMDAGQFYARPVGRHPDFRNSGDHYAMARYLLYYLQARGQLERYYRAFRAAAAADPGGYATLRAVLGEEGKDMAAFQQRWQRWALTLRFPPSD